MNQIDPNYINRAENWLLITTLAYFLMNGAQIFETAVVVPKWSAQPPASIAVLQGAFAPDLKTFWIAAHSVHELTFFAAIFFCWQLHDVRLPLLIIIGLHFLVRIWTLCYFAPNIMAFQKSDLSVVSVQLQSAVRLWRNLNYIRVGAFILLSICVAVQYNKVRHNQKYHAENSNTETHKLNTQAN